MSSSTSSSDASYNKGFLIFGITLVLLVLLAGIANLLLFSTVEKKAFEEKRQEASFWQEKLRADHAYSLLILGDSRTYRGVNPDIIGQVLSRKCYNLGFSAGGLNLEMFQLAETKLDPTSTENIIVLGVSPLTLSKASRANEQLKSLQARKQDSSDEKRAFLQAFLFPLDHDRWKTIKKGINHKNSPETLYAHGWTSTRHPFSQDRFDNGLSLYRVRAKEYLFSTESLTELAQAVREWKKRGFHVFAFRPPTSDKMEEIENSTYDEAPVKKAFSEAGGIWLDFPVNGYVAYDASHLTTDSAEQFSRDLALAIQRHLDAESAR